MPGASADSANEQPMGSVATRYTGMCAYPDASSIARTFSLMKSTPRTAMVPTPCSAIAIARSAIASESDTWICGQSQAESTPCNSGSM